jgi:hypothetical protein
MLKTDFRIIGSGITDPTFAAKATQIMKRIDLLREETEILYKTTLLSTRLSKLLTMITVSYPIVKCAILRIESRRLLYNTEHLNKSTLIRKFPFMTIHIHS